MAIVRSGSCPMILIARVWCVATSLAPYEKSDPLYNTMARLHANTNFLNLEVPYNKHTNLTNLDVRILCSFEALLLRISCSWSYCWQVIMPMQTSCVRFIHKHCIN